MRNNGVKAGKAIESLRMMVECPLCGNVFPWDWLAEEVEYGVGWRGHLDNNRATVTVTANCGYCEREIEVDVLTIERNGA